MIILAKQLELMPEESYLLEDIEDFVIKKLKTSYWKYKINVDTPMIVCWIHKIKKNIE